jgi:hypothetical protein
MPRSYGLRAQLEFTYILDIDAAVGRHCPNRADDVRLVQYLLAVWQSWEPDTARLLPLLKGTQAMVVDGICGNNTLAVLNTYEQFYKSQVKADGRVDPAFSSPNASKMFHLNSILYLAGGLRGGVPRTRIPFPPQLVYQLFR